MKKIVAIISGDPNSINSEIIAKTWRNKNNFKEINFFIIGNFLLLKKQFSKIRYKIKLKEINSIDTKDLKKNLCIYNVPLKFKRVFNVSTGNKKKYIKESFKKGLNFINKKKIIGLINCAINKKDINSGNNFNGITEFLAKKTGVSGKEAMLIFNKSLAVSPITTHIKLSKVAKNISKEKIIKKIITINNFYIKVLKIKPRIGVLGLNPHNNELDNKSEEKKIIIPALKILKKRGISVIGPLSPDTAFLDYKNKKLNILVGMYHDQVLTPFKTIFKFNAINITLGLPFIRISPDHGIGEKIINKNLANPRSLIESIKFFKRINV